MVVGGKRVTALYLVPEGFEVGEDDGGYMVVQKKAKDIKIDEVDPFETTSDGSPMPPF